MSKKQKRRSTSKKTKWTPPEGSKEFFYASSDDAFQAAHPVGYVFLVILGITVLLLPAILFFIFAASESPWVFLGTIGGFVFGIGLFNFVAIIIDQYLGHWVSILCFAIGSIMMLASWFLCR